MNTSISDCSLSTNELSLLKKANIQTIQDLILTPTQEIAKRCRVSQMDVKRVADKVLNTVPVLQPIRLDTIEAEDEVFTTGDHLLDSMLGGGIRTGMVWEVVGESAAGKSQLALQLALCVQLPPSAGGLSGSTCYLTTSSSLPTTRLIQIASERGLSSTLHDIHTMPAPTTAILEHILNFTLPAFIKQLSSSAPAKKPVRLLIIDALGELFHSSDKTSTSTLVERSKTLTSLSESLHALATRHKLAVVVLNEVIDTFHHEHSSGSTNASFAGGIPYDEQSRWFSTAAYFGDASKEAALGLSWANQVNGRIMLSRTGRRRYLDANERPESMTKRRQVEQEDPDDRQPQPEQGQEREQEPTLIRRLSLLFSTLPNAQPSAVDYIVSLAGICTLRNTLVTAESLAPPPQTRTAPQATDLPLQNPRIQDSTLPGPAASPSPIPGPSAPPGTARDALTLSPPQDPLDLDEIPSSQADEVELEAALAPQPQGYPEQAPPPAKQIQPQPEVEVEEDEFAHVWDADPMYANFDWDKLEVDLSQRVEGSCR